MNSRLFLLLLAVSSLSSMAQPGKVSSDVMKLPNGWSLSPVGEQITLSDLPLNVAVSKDQHYAAVTNNGAGAQSIELISLKTHQVLDIHSARKLWLGLVFGEDSRTLYASGGNDNWILKFAIRNEKLVCTDTIRLGKPWPEKISVAGIAVDEQGQRLYAVTKENNSLYVINLKNNKVKKQLALGGEGYTCLLSPDKKLLYCSCWGCGQVKILKTRSAKWAGSIPVGSNPNDMALDRDGRYLYVANSNDNSVSVIDLQEQKVIETLNAALYPASPEGSTTNSVALSGDDRTLYVANADNNCLAVFDVSKPGSGKGSGFIPTGWYPVCVRVSGKTILVINGKGLHSVPDPEGPNPSIKPGTKVRTTGGHEKVFNVQYIGNFLTGTMSLVPVPDLNQLAEYTQQVYRNTPYRKDEELRSHGEQGNPIPTEVGQKSPIKYVFYVIKENRTYDQVLGDMTEGNGDTTLVLFGEKYTPNQHALAREFVLLDNFYVDGEVSADGHNWSLGAYATDYLEKNWPTYYSDRGGSYDSEGTRSIANNKAGFIWDFCKKAGVSYRTYGEFADDYKPNIPVLDGHYCRYYTSWDQKVMDTTRFRQWRRDFDSLQRINQVPRLNTLRFINDHTEGLRYGARTPFAEVADNDYAVGLFVDYLSKSPIWKESVVLIVEDDAQDGPDHVDAHRSTAYVAGGFVKSGYVDHTPYSTSSFLRTIELILGLPPMSQYDASAEPLWRCFDANANHNPYTVREPRTDLHAMNKQMNEWQRKSEEFNFAKEDRAPDREFNEVLWYACKGEGIPCPAPVHAAFVTSEEGIEDGE